MLGELAGKGTARSALCAGALLAAACAAQGPAFESVTTLPKPARHPAGTDVELQTKWPAAERRGSTGSGLVVLQTPVETNAARRVVWAFFRAVTLESLRELQAVLAPDAMMQNGARRESALNVWGSRFTRFDYRSLAGERIASDSDLKLSNDGDDLLIEVPIQVSWGTRPRMLGDAFTFRLTASGGSWLIVEIAEDFRSP